MKHFKLLDAILNLFDGEGGAAAAGAGDGAASATGTTGDTTGNAPAPTRRGNKSGETTTVIYGKRPTAAEETEPSAAGSAQADVHTTSNTLEERRKAYQDLVNGEYKDLYTEDTQRLINRRFSETKSLQDAAAKTQPIIDLLSQRYGVDSSDLPKLLSAIEDDDGYWEQQAEEHGMTVEQEKQMQRLQRENKALVDAQRQREGEEAAQKQVQQWYAEGEQLKAQYPGFDLQAECGNERFVAMLKVGIDIKTAYEAVHHDELMAGTMQAVAQKTQQAVVANVRARGQRPAENAASSQSAFTYKDDVSKLTRKDRAEIARRASRGERIEF